MARTVLRRDGEMIYFEIIWSLDEWCKRLPEWWPTCSRCIDKSVSPFKDVIMCRDGFCVRCDEEKCCIYPWPRRLYRRLF